MVIVSTAGDFSGKVIVLKMLDSIVSDSDIAYSSEDMY